MKRKIIIICAVIMVLFFAVGVSASKYGLSPALDVISASCDMVVSGTKGTAVCFSENDFVSHAVYDHHSITVTELPPAADGVLMLGSSEISAGQTVSGANLDLLRFVPSGNADESCFYFTSDKSYTTKCVILLTEKENSAPIAAGAGMTTVTQEDISCHGVLTARDPEGDSLLFEIIAYPENGIVTLTDCQRGDFVYTPYEDFVGIDTFTYRVRDNLGNYSGSCEVSLRVDERAGEDVLSDMDGHWAYSAALSMVAEGHMDVISENGKLYFDPDETMTREEYLTLVMKALGACELSPVNTSFEDNDMIDGRYSGYVSAALKLGIVSGTETNGRLYFYPKEPITRAEAAVILNRILGAEPTGTVETFASEEAVPTWATGDIAALRELGIMPSLDGEGTLTSLTRAEAAHMLYATGNIYS